MDYNKRVEMNYLLNYWKQSLIINPYAYGTVSINYIEPISHVYRRDVESFRTHRCGDIAASSFAT